MTPREAIDKAVSILSKDRELKSLLNRTGNVRVPVIGETPVTPQPDVLPTDGPIPLVIFTIEDSPFGRQLFAEYSGHKELAS